MSSTLKKTFPVTGMHCAACAITVEKTLKAQQGIEQASVNYANATANVAYNDKADLNKIKDAVTSAGYGLIVNEDEATPEKMDAINRKNYNTLKRRTILAIIFSIPLAVIGMAEMSFRYHNYVMWALATPVVFISGRQFFIGAAKQLSHFTANMDTLVALSTGIAYLFSIFNTLYPQYLSKNGVPADVYFEASAVVIAFILLGKMLEEKAKTRTSSAIKKLIGLQPDIVTRILDGDIEEDVSIKNIIAGNLLLVRPGDKIPVDGTVTVGSSFVDESMISGEPVAVLKNEGAKVFAGTINQTGSFRFTAEKVGKDTLLAHIIQKVQEAQGSKAPIQKLADRIAGVFVPIVLVLALASLAAWLIWGGSDGLAHGVLAMVTVLVIACPCALGLATPTAIITGMGKGAERGILIKDAESLEMAHKLTTIVLDKTGTLTEGRPEVTDIAWRQDSDTALLSSVLYSMEALSEHPLARAVTGFFKNIGIQPVNVTSFDSITGSGVTAVYARKIYFVGNQKLIDSLGVPVPDYLSKQATLWTNEANTVVWLADQYKVLAAVAISDKIKGETSGAIARLKHMGLEVMMLTGDADRTAAIIAAEAGITNYKAGASPTEKLNVIKQLQEQGKIVAMVGDGINDGPALAQADVSIAMGKGTDIAIDVAKMTLMSSDLRLLPEAIRLSQQTVRVIRQNLFWAFIYNVIGIPIAAGVLYPVNGFMLSPMIAGAAMALSSVSVVSNSLRLKWRKSENFSQTNMHPTA